MDCWNLLAYSSPGPSVAMGGSSLQRCWENLAEAPCGSQLPKKVLTPCWGNKVMLQCFTTNGSHPTHCCHQALGGQQQSDHPSTAPSVGQPEAPAVDVAMEGARDVVNDILDQGSSGYTQQPFLVLEPSNHKRWYNEMVMVNIVEQIN